MPSANSPLLLSAICVDRNSGLCSPGLHPPNTPFKVGSDPIPFSVFLLAYAHVIRTSIFTFLKNFHLFTTTSPIFLLLLPFSVSSLFWQALVLRFPSPLETDDLPVSIFLLVSCFTSFVFFLAKAKSLILRVMDPWKSLPSPPASSLRKPLLAIQSFNLFLLCLSSASYGLVKSRFLIADHTLLIILVGTSYYTVCTNMAAVFNLAFIVSETRNLSAYASVREAFLLRVRYSTTLSLALASSTGSVAIEALFRYRIMRVSNHSWRTVFSLSLEGLLIGYLYSVVVVLDTIACFLFVNGYGSELKPNSASDSNTESASKVVEDFSSCAQAHINL